MTRPAPPTVSDAEIYTPDQLEAHAAQIAARPAGIQSAARAPAAAEARRERRRLDETYQFLSRSRGSTPSRSAPRTGCATTTTSSRTRSARSGRTCRGSTTSSCPSSRTGRFAGYPRVYLLARELIAHTAGRIDLETLVDFAVAYQRVAPLSIGETWAIPIMLRLGLVEELRRLADGVVAARRSREQAPAWDARARPHPTSGRSRRSAGCCGRGASEDGRLSAAFVVELLQWLRDQPLTAGPAWQALQRALEAQDDSAEEMLRVEHQREAADQLAIGNVITSMRLLSSIDWPLFFERVSLVEQILRGGSVRARTR